ncbi:MAG: hypothetical protein NZ750_07000 [Anaerolineae bacterium]|nr:hypothetical protein [Anaerolineae bacterium]MDW8170858.1 hypothetical protein [Anaerolineae bacterium]
MIGLEHFYYGQLVHHGQLKGSPRVLARSCGVSDDMVAVALRVALLPAHVDLPLSAWGLLRSKEVPFIFVQAQKTTEGQTMRHFVFLPPDIPRGLQGAVGELQALVQERLPNYEMLGDTLPQVEFERPPQRSANQQANDLLELMTLTGNNTRTLEPLLSAIIEGRPLVVRRAPNDPKSRYDFVEGLLTLLPPSTRFSVSFALYNEAASLVQAQISFAEDVEQGAVVYDWAAHRVDGLDTPDDYSRFILSQLRLDAQIAVQQAEALTQTAGWRFRVGDSLADSLAYASYRAKLDRSVLSNLPVEAREVAQVLADDPTLDDAMRLAYARHLLTFSLALDDAQHVDPLAVTMSKYPDLAREAFMQLEDALRQGKAPLVFAMLHSWADNPLSPQGPEWVDLLHRSAIAAVQSAIKARDIGAIHDFLERTQLLEGSLLLEKIALRLVDLLVGVADQDDRLPSRILLIALNCLEKPSIQRLLTFKPYAVTLPRSIKRFLASLAATDAEPSPRLLVEAAESVGSAGRGQALVRLAEMAHEAGRRSLIDAAALRELVKVARSPLGDKYGVILLKIARFVYERLDSLSDDAARAVLQLFMACKRVDLLARGMNDLSRHLFEQERQDEYVEMVRALLAEVPLSAQEARKILEALTDYGIRDVPLMMAVCGALEASGHSAELLDYARETADELTSSERYAELSAPMAIQHLITYFVRQRDEERLLRLARLMARAAALQVDEKLSLNSISQNYKTLREASDAIAFALLRHYVRLAAPKPAERVIGFYGNEIGGSAGRQLRLAYDLSLAMNRLSLERYAAIVHSGAELLQALAEAYSGRDKPSIALLDALLENFRARIDSALHQTFAQNLRNLGRAILLIGKPNGDTLTLGDPGRPRHALDILRLMGLHLSKGKPAPLKLRQEGRSLSLFGPSAPMALVTETADFAAVLRAAAQTLPTNRVASLNAASLGAELDDLLNTLPQEEAADVADGLGADLQRLTQLLPLILHNADPAVLQDDNRLGKKLDQQVQQPRNPLELLRFIYGFWLDK